MDKKPTKKEIAAWKRLALCLIIGNILGMFFAK